jgi:hypothetical protein
MAPAIKHRGLIGREGMTGLAVVTGTDRSPSETFHAGRGQRIPNGSYGAPKAEDRRLFG